MNQFELALEFYEGATPSILAEKQNSWALDPSSFGEYFRMTPIESATWERIREVRAVFYPQYPVGKFFADFANPVAKVVIECDGLDFHQDRASDSERDARFHALGWTVYRIPGRLCVSEFNEDDLKDEFSFRLIRAIADRNGLIRGDPPPCKIDEEMADCLRYSAQGKLALLGILP